MNDPRWYAVMTQARREHDATVHLRRQGYMVFYPHWRRIRRVGRGRFIREENRPLFPRYCFVAFRGFEHESFGEVNDTIGVATVVKKPFSGEPLEIPGDVMTEIMDWADQEGFVVTEKPPHWFKGKPGDRIDFIRESAFYGFVATISSIEELDKNGQIRVWLKMLGADREMTVSADAVKVRDGRAA